jgi:hypothetical protein
MNPLTKFVALAIFFCGLPSCTFSVPQAESVLRQIQTLVSEESSGEEVLWLASYEGQGAVLKPYAAEGYTVFANESGDAIAFDGWVVRSVLGFGLEQAITISDDGWVRSSRSGKDSFVATCSEWQKDTATKGYQWRQICGIYSHETVIYVDETGSIGGIKQAFGGDLGTLTLNLRR